MELWLTSFKENNVTSLVKIVAIYIFYLFSINTLRNGRFVIITVIAEKFFKYVTWNVKQN